MLRAKVVRTTFSLIPNLSPGGEGVLASFKLAGFEATGLQPVVVHFVTILHM